MYSKEWPEEDVHQLIDLYTQQNIKDPQALGDILNRNYRSIISKLVQLRIYEKPVETKIRKKTVKEMLRYLEQTFKISIDGINLSKKENLEALVSGVESFVEQSKRG